MGSIGPQVLQNQAVFTKKKGIETFGSEIGSLCEPEMLGDAKHNISYQTGERPRPTPLDFATPSAATTTSDTTTEKE